MFEIKSMTYEESRRKYFEEQMQKAQRSMKYWEARIDRTRPNNLMDVAHGKAADAGWEYNFYKDALEALEDNKFKYETGFVRGFEAAQLKWISAEKRPKQEGQYIVRAITFGGAIINSWDIFTTGAGWCGEGSDFKKILYYMTYGSLPEPPKEENT